MTRSQLTTACILVFLGFSQSVEAQNITSYTYDAQGQVMTVRHPVNGTATPKSTYTYDTAGNRTLVKTELNPPSNLAPVCHAPIVQNLSIPPQASPITLTFASPITCSDDDGDTLTLVSVTAPATLSANIITVSNIIAGYNKTFTYVISDGQATASQTITVTR